MSEEKFTKGEWKAIDNGVFIDVHAVDSDGYYLDQVCMGVSYDNKEDAPLIANSKAMYEYLYHMVEHDVINDPSIEREVKKLLAKARGEKC